MSPRIATHEPEITHPVPIATPLGRLERASVGFARTPLFEGRIEGRWGRRKRWEYWAVVARTHLISITLADLDYVGVASAWFVDLERDRRIELVWPMLPSRMPRFPDRVAGGDLAVELPGLSLAIRETPESTRLSLAMRTPGHRVDAVVDVAKPPGHESLSVLVPFSEDAFQLTSKHVARPARGLAIVDGERFPFGPERESYGALDFGRGVFPHRTRWNWSAAAGRVGERIVGWNLGGQWTDGTGVTENGVFVDGRLHKLGEDVRFAFDPRRPERPWRITSLGSSAIDLEFEPLHLKRVDALHGPLGADLWLGFGRFRGRVHTELGERIEIVDHVGWAEELHARW